MSLFEFDIHTHTIASGHYTQDTVTAMVKYAAGKGLKLLGISEHGPALPHSCTLSYFRGLSHAPSMRMGIHVLYGAEANILDSSGRLDLPDDVMERLDYCLAGIHPPCFIPGTKKVQNIPDKTNISVLKNIPEAANASGIKNTFKAANASEENTMAYIRAMANPHIHAIAHPDDTKYPVDYRRLVEAAIEYHVLLEINNSSLSPYGYRGNTRKNDRTILELCKKYHYPVLLSSDSHGHKDIGNFQYAMELIRETAFPMELVLNTSAEKLLHFLL